MNELSQDQADESRPLGALQGPDGLVTWSAEAQSASITRLFINGREVWPCWCGVRHEGDYGLYEYGWHHCTHPEFMALYEETIMCVSCGMVSELASANGVATK